MLRKVISYKDYNGKERKEAFYFNLSKAEVIEMELSADGGMENFMQSIIDTKDNRRLFNLFKDMIYKSYGIKSEDGRRFVKSKEISDAFVQTEAYTELLMELMGDDAATKVAEFVRGIMPFDGVSDSEFNKAFSTAAAKVDTFDVPTTEGKTVPITAGN